MKIRGLLLAAALLVCSNVFATTYTFEGTLSGADEVPAVASPGTGSATVILDTTAETLFVDVTFSGLDGTTTASHIHCCTALEDTGNAGVATTVPTFAGFPLGVTSGTYINTLDLTLASSYNPAFVTASGGTVAAAEAALEAGLLGDKAYLNIHTNLHPSGEVRALLDRVPEPSTLLLLGTGLLGLVGSAKRKFFS